MRPQEEGFRQNAHLTEDVDIKRAVAQGRFMAREMIAVIHLKKYRTRSGVITTDFVCSLYTELLYNSSSTLNSTRLVHNNKIFQARAQIELSCERIWQGSKRSFRPLLDALYADKRLSVRKCGLGEDNSVEKADIFS